MTGGRDITTRGRSRSARPGSVMLVVLWAIAIISLVTISVQLLAYRQAYAGREALGRVEARWAARGGVERTIAVMAYFSDLEEPIDPDPLAMIYEMDRVADGEFVGGTYEIRYEADGVLWRGPLDEHSRLNVNLATRDQLMLLDRMSLDVADGILDWIDEDENPREFGAEVEWYANAPFPLRPRNAPMRTHAELELVAGAFPKYVRGEDWNFNNRLDPNENDGNLSVPDDNSDDLLDGGWASFLTPYSLAGGPTLSGQERLWYQRVNEAMLVERLGVDEQQALALLAFGRNTSNQLGQLLVTGLEYVQQDGSMAAQPVNPEISPLNDRQLEAVFVETSIADPRIPAPGKINLNTVSERLLRQLLPDSQRTVDEIMHLRKTGIVSVAQLREIPGIKDDELLSLATMMDTTSNVYTINSRGRSRMTGTEIEMIVVVDRSTLPITIIEYREQ